MPRFIIGLEHAGGQFMTDVIQYCQKSGQPNTPEVSKQIYQECLSQIFANMTDDAQDFTLKIMSIPAWSTINYTDAPINPLHYVEFAAAVRSMALQLWHRLNSKGNLDGRYLYLVESCSTTFVVVSTYTEAGYV